MKSKRAGVTTSEQAYVRVKSYLMDGALSPGVHLNTASLGQKLNIGQTALRNALTVLAMEKLVAFQPHKGFFVRTPSYREFRGLYLINSYLSERILHSIAADSDRDPSSVDREAFRNALQSDKNEDLDARSPVERVAAFFELVGRLSGCEVIAEHLRANGERLHAARISEFSVFPDAAEELTQLFSEMRGMHLAELHSGTQRYHERRLRDLRKILRNAFGAGFLDDGDDKAVSAGGENVAFLFPERRRGSTS